MAETSQTNSNLILTSGYTDKMVEFNVDGTSTISHQQAFKINDKEVVRTVVSNPKTLSYIREHFAKVIEDDLGIKVPSGEGNYTSKEGDIVFVASYVGPRIKKTDTGLPQEGTVDYKCFLMGDHPEAGVDYIRELAEKLTGNQQIVDPDECEDPDTLADATEMLETYHSKSSNEQEEESLEEAVV